VKRCFIIIAILCACIGATAQVVPDSKGTDFWLTFLPNFHNNLSDIISQPQLALEHQLYIYIGSETPTSGTITLRDSAGLTRVVPFNITDPSKIFEFQTFFLPYELRGCNWHGDMDRFNMQNERPVPTSIHIQSTQDVTVYALNQGWFTSDAFMVLPTDAVATDYAVMSYTSDVTMGGSEPVSSSTPSQFAVVATENNTTVTIRPSAPTFLSPGLEEQTVVLNQGESYLVQADPWAGNRLDLTGSIVSASKPIAVFGGHQRATVPIEFNNSLGSRDCLVEQLTPISTWGKSAFVSNLAMSSTELNIGYSLYRVVAAFDSTEIYVDGARTAMIHSGEHYEAPIFGAMEIVTTRPTMVAMFKKTAGQGSQQVQRVGDPFMMIVPPAEQFMDKYRFINIQAYDYEIVNGNVVVLGNVYVEQYLNIVIPTTKAATVTLDGALVPLSRFSQIGTSDYSWAQLRMADGVHDIRADTLFGIYVYGYGGANSYGYIGGMAFRPLDNFPPKILGKTNCGSFNGRVTDSLLGDTRVRSVQPVAGTEQNVRFTLGQFDPPQAIVPFTMTLINPYLDGRIVIEAMDNVRQRVQTTVNLPGYTIGLKDRDGDPTPENRLKIFPVNRLRCDTFTLENYGLFPHVISSIGTTNGAVISGITLPDTLKPGESVDITVCFNIMQRGTSADTIIIGDSCITRLPLVYTIDAKDDEDSPIITGNVDSCATEVRVAVADERSYDFGLRSVRIMNEVQANCTIAVVSESVPLSVYTVTVTDPLYDAVYGFEAVDSADNISQFIDTVQGFTLAFNGERGMFSSAGIPSTTLGTVYCDTILVTNYGIKPHVLSGVFIRGNIRFSLPQGQFDITVLPGGEIPLVVCYEPTEVKESPDIDTLVFFHGCDIKQMELQGMGESVAYNGIARCNTPVDVSVSKTGRLQTIPMPANETFTLVLGQSTSRLNVRVLDVAGNVVLQRRWEGATTRSFTIDIAQLPEGAYVVVAETASKIETGLLIVE